MLDPLIEGCRHELIGEAFTIYEPGTSLIASENRKFNYRYMTAEAFWNIGPTDDIGLLRRYFSGVDRFTADQDPRSRQNATWAYGPTLNHFIPIAVDELRKNPTSRRAIVNLRVFNGVPGTPPCLNSLQWLIRKGCLEQITTMRSNDVYLGLPMDLYQFGIIHRLVAAALDVPLGPYHHRVGSMHMYDRDVAKVQGFLRGKVSGVVAPPFSDSVALHKAICAVPANMVRMYGHRPGEWGSSIDYSICPGLQPYMALLLGDYNSVGMAFNALREQGYGIGWE